MELTVTKKSSRDIYQKHERCLQSSLLLGIQVTDSERTIQEKLKSAQVKKYKKH